jgi:hypothetical protein
LATNNRERILADSQFGSGAITSSGTGVLATLVAPATWYLGLSTTAPNEDGTGFTEPTGGSYARVAVTNNSTNFPAAAVSDTTTKTNGAVIPFPTPTGTWGLITYYGWFLTASGGTGPEYFFPLDASITVKSGNTPVQFDAGALSMQFE